MSESISSLKGRSFRYEHRNAYYMDRGWTVDTRAELSDVRVSILRHQARIGTELGFMFINGPDLDALIDSLISARAILEVNKKEET